MKIDVFPHIIPRAYFERMLKVGPTQLHMAKRMRGIPVLVDLDLRFRMMDRYEGYVQVLTLANPPVEIVAKHPDRFLSFVASMPMNNPEAIVPEIDRAITELGATGIQIFTNVNGKALDASEFRPMFARMAEHRLPIWIHPARTPLIPDYAGESRSKFDVWWAFGWPYETTAAMARLVFSGVFDRHPELAIITHHLGAMVPYFEMRAAGGLDQLGTRTDDPDDMAALSRLRKRPIDYFHMFYGDTAVFGSAPALQCGLAFFGADRVLFGTDMPFDPEQGPGFVRDTIGAIEAITITPEERAKIYEGNARRLLKLRLGGRS